MTTNVQTMIYVNGKWFDKKLCDRVKTHVLSQSSSLPLYVEKRLRQICGKEFWNSLTKGEKIHAGLFISSLVEKNELPLQFGEPVSSSRTFYKI